MSEHTRSLRHVVFEFVEILTHADSRLWRTLRRLALDPARLTSDYLEGRRACEIPPLRIFFVILLILFAAGSLGGSVHTTGPVGIDRPALAAWLRARDWPPEVTVWLQAHIERAAADPRAVLEVMRAWSERFAVLMMPIATILLCLIFVADRRHVAYDHAIFSLHSLSFSFVVLTIFVLLDELVGDASFLVLLVLPPHLFVHMRGVYGTRPIGTLIRMAALAVGSVVGILTLLLGLVLVSLQLADG